MLAQQMQFMIPGTTMQPVVSVGLAAVGTDRQCNVTVYENRNVDVPHCNKPDFGPAKIQLHIKLQQLNSTFVLNNVFDICVLNAQSDAFMI